MTLYQTRFLRVVAAGGWEFISQQRWVLALWCVVWLAGPAVAVERPFQGRIEGRLVASPTSDLAVYQGSAQAAGRATHVGAFTKVTSDMTNVVTGELVGSFTMTAPNGDRLTGVYTGLLVFGNTPGTFSWVLDATITGGTGRFAAASGEFVFVARGESLILDGVVHGQYSETFDGTIDY
jgi:hypothetical protein